MRAVATRRLFLALGLAAGLTGLAACDRGGGGPTASAQGDMSLGRADAPVTVIEYASSSCSHCARWNQEVWPEFKRRYVDSGRVRYVFREFLTEPRAYAASSFLLARCAAAADRPERYFSVLDAVFRSQEEVFRTGDTRAPLLRIAQSTGMSEQQFTTCLRDEAALNALNDRVERAAREDQIESTPTFVVNGRRLIGEQSLAQLAAAIDPLLGANAPAPVAGASGSAATPAAGGSTPAATPNPAPAGAASGSASGATSATSGSAVAPTPVGPATASTAASGSPAQ